MGLHTRGTEDWICQLYFDIYKGCSKTAISDNFIFYLLNDFNTCILICIGHSSKTNVYHFLFVEMTFMNTIPPFRICCADPILFLSITGCSFIKILEHSE